MQLTSCYLFRGLNDSQLNRLTAISEQVKLENGQWLFQENSVAEKIYILKSGAIELLTSVEGSVELPITVVRFPGGCFGSSALVSPFQYSLSARAAEDSLVLSMKRSDLQTLIHQDRELGYRIMTNLAGHLLDRLKQTRQELKVHFRNLFRYVHA